MYALRRQTTGGFYNEMIRLAAFHFLKHKSLRMTQEDSLPFSFHFLQGGGEMGRLTRAYDWAATPVGPPDEWPQSLRTTVSIILNSKFPMFMWWGSDLIQFYNDAYRPSLGHNGKHPTALGQRGEECWPEIWPIIKPMLDQVLAGGEATWSEDQLIPFYRNGRLEDIYWTFSYSPVYGEKGEVAGVLTVCQETTQQVSTQRRLELSEERFRRLIEQAPVAVALFSGPKFVITLANERVLEYWGRRREQVMQLPLFEALPEASGQGFEELLTGVYTTGLPFVARELTVTLERNGVLAPTYIDFVYEPFYELDGRISGVLVVCTEITEQVLARQKIEISESRFRSLIEEAPVATCLFVGRNQVIEVANEVMMSYWGKGKEVIGKTFQEAVPEMVGQPFLEILEEVFTTGKTYTAESMKCELEVNGELRTFYFDFTYKPLRNAAGEVYAIMDMALDVTDQVLAGTKLKASEERYRVLSQELEEQVQHRTQELALLNEALSSANIQLTESNSKLISSNENLQTFAYAASHDLQEPLRKIQQFSNLLKTQYVPSQGNEKLYLERMDAAAKRMSTLIEDLLNFSRLSSQLGTQEAVSLDKVFQSVLADLDVLIAETGTQIHLTALPTILGDHTQLGHLFQNLLTNAMKFTSADTLPDIHISAQISTPNELPPHLKPAQMATAYHRIDVQDNGIGFEEKYLDRIFNVFQRLNGRSEYAGTGIGLAICERVARNHGGGITARSQPGKGSTFSVFFPMQETERLPLQIR